MMRFFFRTDENTPAKITRAVDFPMRLDVRKWIAKDVVAPNYGLRALITHRGRACDSGHYVAHVRADDEWYRYDDEKVSVVEEEQIRFLKGGAADWHCSYILIYEAA
jgi:ubiquitin carboxyl-terminal hydrolase 14